LGLALHSPGDLSLALGTDEVTPSEFLSAYVPLVNGGFRAETRTIIRIYERYHNAWVEIPSILTPVLDPAVGYVTTQMLRDVLVYGTAKSLVGFAQMRPAAGKTGTTDDYRDAWFVGYTPQLVTAVWAGYDKPRSLGKGSTGGTVCAPIWGRFMTAALADQPLADFIRPEGVVSLQIDPLTSGLARTGCPRGREEFFLAGTFPDEPCPLHEGEILTPVTDLPPTAWPDVLPQAEPPPVPLPTEPEQPSGPSGVGDFPGIQDTTGIEGLLDPP